MPLFSRPRRFLVPLVVIGFLPAAWCVAQQTQTIPSQSKPGYSSSQTGENPAPTPQLSMPAEKKSAPGTASLMDPAGPTVSLETSEALFNIAVALNACGYDRGLEESNPVRKRVRDEVNQAGVDSARARDDRDKLCLFIDEHRLDDASRSLAQYVSLALYLTPPPEMTPSVEKEDLPPDASGVEEILPLLRKYAEDADLHAIWLENRPAYEEAVNRLHTPLSQMIVNTNYYLKVPASVSNARRFLVVLEPMLSPAETNARVYGQDYVVVASPKDGQIQMSLVRHAYLHYEIEPLLYQRQDSMDRMLPLLRLVADAPLQFTFKSDIVAMVIESMIRAIEARTMDTGVELVKVPAGLSHSAADPYERARSVAEEKIAAIRQQNVDHSMTQGYVLTQYFYSQLLIFEKSPESLDEAIGPMVYGMDVATEMHRAKQITFDAQGEDDPMSHSPEQPKGLELAEMKLIQGDGAGAADLAQQAMKTEEAPQACLILGEAELISRKVPEAVDAFNKAIETSKDPRTLAWAHIFLGRIHDLNEERDEAVAEYKAALTVRDGQPDTKEAAESGLKEPFTLPKRPGTASGTGGTETAPGAPSAAPATPEAAPDSQAHPQ